MDNWTNYTLENYGIGTNRQQRPRGRARIDNQQGGNIGRLNPQGIGHQLFGAGRGNNNRGRGGHHHTQNNVPTIGGSRGNNDNTHRDFQRRNNRPGSSVRQVNNDRGNNNDNTHRDFQRRNNRPGSSVRQVNNDRGNNNDNTHRDFQRRNNRPGSSVRQVNNDSRGNNNYNGNNDNNQRDHQRRNNRNGRPDRRMGFRYVEELLNNTDLQAVMFKLSNDSSGFKNLLDDKDISDDMIVSLVKLLTLVCTSEFQSVQIEILTSVLESRFMDKLTSYINGIMLQNENQKFRNKYFWNDPDNFWNDLIKISKTVTETIPTYCEAIEKLLTIMTMFIPQIESRHAMHISDSIKLEAANLLEIVKKTIQDIEVKRQVKQVAKREGRILDDNMEPPNDFLDISIIPQAIEVTLDTSPFVRSNIVDRAYDNVDHYLDIQFRLLREDFIAPLRRGIRSYLENDKRPKDIKIYNPIRFLNVETINECNCYRIQFNFSKKKQVFKYENSKKFMFGSLVCFTNDNFATVLFGKIVDRDEKLLKNSQLKVGFQQDEVITYDSDYLMVESSVYFEPYYQVLGALQRMKRQANRFPMEKYIIKVEKDSLPPQYLAQKLCSYEIEGRRFIPLMSFPSRFYGLNDSQFEAFKAALTREFCIIQGPPGTGKTHLGLKIGQTLLENSSAWYNNTPILVICYTNHALDQFLEGLLPVTEKILRVGGQSKNENLMPYNIASKRREFRKKERAEKAIFQKRDEVMKFMRTIKALNDTRNTIEANESVLNFNVFRDIETYQNSWFADAKKEDILRWLLEGANVHVREKPTQRGNTREIQEGIENLDLDDEDDEEETIEDLNENQDRQVDVDDIFINITVNGDGSLISLKQLKDHLKTLNNALDDLNFQDDLNSLIQTEKIENDIRETEGFIEYITDQLARYKAATTPLRPLNVNVQNPFAMIPNDRWLLYFHWLDLYQVQLREKYRESDVRFKEVYRVYDEMREMEDTQIMRQNLVIGMTTTGAARLHSSLKALRSPIVIVEEAAEVLEAHIVAALTSHCQHLILIGDHLQLKPGAADYRIEKTYKLGISLFERMVNNKIECHTLNVQHRMRPEISSLIKPHIYRNLEDHESTLQRDPILGIPKCLYFIDHNIQEELCQDASKKNVHEVKFLIALAKYLILNGYRPEQITILSAYLGQMFEMVREKKKHNMLLQDVRISVLDNYQGEESDIILLSLVRSNLEDVAGFLKIQNRVCVALSRARDGFYLMGNMSLLLNSKSENQIWSHVNQTLINQDAIGRSLTLRCQIHPYRFTQVSTSKDFNKVVEGGCDLPCGAELPCGHNCKRHCHIQDRDHNFTKCMEKCSKTLCNDRRHICLKLCFEDCGPCTYILPRYLQCDHLVRIACYIDPDTYECTELVPTKLPCNHNADKPCFKDPFKFKCPHRCDTRVEPCGHACTRLCHVRVDPDHLDYRCTQPCARPRRGCKAAEQHICSKVCYQDCEDCMKQVKKYKSCGHVYTIACNMNVEEIKCEKPCKKSLICGHPCKNKCLEKCGPCNVMVEKIIPECGHSVKIRCSEYPTRQYCQSRTCPRLLPCGHKCTQVCQSECTQKCMEMVDCNIFSTCGHKITKIQCHLKNTTNPQVLLEHCTSPCVVDLKCKHPCSGSCGECLQSRIHKRCTEKCGVPLVCNHECPIPCREACKPCTRKCEMKCEHSKCMKNCGEPCTPCKSPCSRRCEHVQCTRQCGAICNVAPCTEKCKKTLNCGHPCVGFCNDPCPILCRICDKEELTTIFLGNEDEPEATYVMLNDCKHIFESTDLDGWLNQNENEIKFKVCPRCTKNITTTVRYNDYIKRALNDVVSAKEKSFGEVGANEEFRKELINELLMLKLNGSQQLFLACPDLEEVINKLVTRLQPVVGRRRQAINNIELNAVKSKLQTLTYILDCFDGVKHTYSKKDASILHLDLLLKVLMRSVDHVTDQEVEDLELEIKRLHRIVQYEKIKNSYTYSPSLEILSTEQKISLYLFSQSRYDVTIDNLIKTRLTQYSSEVKSSIPIDDKERMDIVRAMGLAKGHWFKCPNGHPYVIGECGGAMQVAKCVCGAAIGGSEHHLLESNQFAGEMDGAQRHAWPGGLH